MTLPEFVERSIIAGKAKDVKLETLNRWLGELRTIPEGALPILFRQVEQWKRRPKNFPARVKRLYELLEIVGAKGRDSTRTSFLHRPHPQGR